MYILISLALVFAASVIDWQKDKSSLAEAWKKNFLKYIAMFVVGGFLIGYLLTLAIAHDIFVAGVVALVYLFWTFIVNFLSGVFKKK